MNEGTERRSDVGSFAEVTARHLKWLWPNRFPLGKISLLVGVPGKGKSFLSVYMASQVSTGKPWADRPGESRKPGSALLLTAEDDLHDTVKPRLLAAGADVSRVRWIRGYTEGKSGYVEGLYNLTRDVDILRDAIKQVPDMQLVIVDPITSYMQGLDDNKNSDVRAFLMPLAALAEEFNIAILCIHHLNKNEKASIEHRVMGSTGYTAAARAVWLVEEDAADRDRRLLLWVKGNLSGGTQGLAFHFEPTTITMEDGTHGTCHYCAFESNPVKMLARDVLRGEQQSFGRPRKRESAAEWLRSYLADGEKPADDVFRDGEAAGYGEGTIKKAKKIVGVQSVKTADSRNPLGGKWMWSISPEDDDL